MISTFTMEAGLVIAALMAVVGGRVIVVDSPDPRIFEQAIFILPTDGGGVSSRQLVDEAVRAAEGKVLPQVYDFCEPGPVHRCIHAVCHQIEDHAQAAGICTRFAATWLIEGDASMEEVLRLDQNEKELIEHSVLQMEQERGLDRNAALADMRYSFIEKLVREAVVKPRESRQHRRSVQADKILTGKYTAIPIFIGVMFLIFFLTFHVIGAFLSDLLALGIDRLTQIVDAALTAYGLNPVVQSLIIDGIFEGVGSVLSFLPVIVTLFFFLSILEDTGYMARVAFVMDKLLRRIGVTEAVVTTGHLADTLIAYLESLDSGIRFHFVHNPKYRETNYIYSMYLARNLLRGQDVISLHGDLVLHPTVMDALAASGRSVMAVDSTAPAGQGLQGADSGRAHPARRCGLLRRGQRGMSGSVPLASGGFFQLDGRNRALCGAWGREVLRRERVQRCVRGDSAVPAGGWREALR